MTSKELTRQLCEQKKWDFEKLEKYHELITEANKNINLTGFYDDELWQSGILESLLFMDSIVQNRNSIKILDIGAGAGFPSIPFAISSKDNEFHIYEPIQKRVNFLNTVIKELNLKNVHVKAIRSEEVKEKNIFDLVTARAVASIRALLMSSFHLVKVNGDMRLIKSKKYQDELKKASDVLKLLKTEINSYKLEVPNTNKEHVVVNIKKLRSTPKEFPFEWRKIVKK
ncbi:16S rRNA (guanine(527)-N(7))-methyltransferase RsmG [Mycoplasma sp. Ms02]|uniref:16S rRNA (guanine(527)-N(7))-methyltransferase RsmG n=1 Tax=Mycoplasma sp. Ms02 TaxID=353851 RepID=UPI001C8947F5|nr:16S rRNA (guanine(527)-N(7))-methyltransferase RsmG [Mycoplasma sp. Ms02]QZE12172.1 16S rRNA (guanine(527)-N(7))-methyltransferase RsmG [Mycoplasma sp. Ms02]